MWVCEALPTGVLPPDGRKSNHTYTCPHTMIQKIAKQTKPLFHYFNHPCCKLLKKMLRLFCNLSVLCPEACAGPFFSQEKALQGGMASQTHKAYAADRECVREREREREREQKVKRRKRSNEPKRHTRHFPRQTGNSELPTKLGGGRENTAAINSLLSRDFLTANPRFLPPPSPLLPSSHPQRKAIRRGGKSRPAFLRRLSHGGGQRRSQRGTAPSFLPTKMTNLLLHWLGWEHKLSCL